MALLFGRVFRDNRILMGVVATLATGLGTGVGHVPVILTTDIFDRFSYALQGSAADVMLTATVVSLITPATAKGGI